MVKDHSDSSTAITWATPFNLQQGIFYMHHLTGRIAHSDIPDFATLVVEHRLEQDDPLHHEWTLYYKGFFLEVGVIKKIGNTRVCQLVIELHGFW